MEKEIWKDVVGYEGLYKVSSLGAVCSLNYNSTGVAKKLRLVTNYGYKQVALCRDRKRKTFKVHRLVAQAFIANINNKPQVNHINEIRGDNRVVNLNWVTGKENVNHGTCIQKIVDTRSIPIKQLTLNGELVKKWKSAKESSKNGFCQGAISNCCNKKPRFNTHKGFRWEFV